MPRKVIPAIDRFLAKISRDATACCVLWLGGKHRAGYGAFDGGYAHRFSYETFVGPIPDGYEINHKCRVKACVAPDHLEALTPEQHRAVDRDIKILGAILGGQVTGQKKRARVACRNGHTYNEANTYIYRGYRMCRRCHADTEASRRESLRAAGRMPPISRRQSTGRNVESTGDRDVAAFAELHARSRRQRAKP